MGRDDAWTLAIRPTGRRTGAISSPGEHRSAVVFSGEITTPRSWPRTESPELSAENLEEFGDYVVIEQIGIGGMATVHRAERRTGRVRQRVALKRMLPSAASDPDHVKLFLDEARLVSHLHHRNIAEIYEFGQVGSEYFLAMELVAGPTLKNLMRQSENTVGLIPYPIALNLLSQVCEALAYAHDLPDKRGNPLHLVHRDVSPSNIVISSNGVVKLIDFGVAKTATTHTQAGVIKGKLGYIAPEYLQGEIDRRADLWAVGVIAYELLAGRKLFSADSDYDLMLAVRSAPIEPPSVHNPDVPPELDAIVMTALQRDPNLRWQNAAALRNALQGVGRASTNAEVIEWAGWVNSIPAGAPRPVRGSRSMPAAQPNPHRLALPPPPATAQHGVPHLPTQQLQPFVHHPPYQPPQLHLRLPAQRPACAIPKVGAAMIARRRRVRLLVPLLLILLGGVASAIFVPMLYDVLAKWQL